MPAQHHPQFVAALCLSATRSTPLRRQASSAIDAERCCAALVVLAGAFAGADVETAAGLMRALDRVVPRHRLVLVGGSSSLQRRRARTRRSSASVTAAGVQDVSRAACAASSRVRAAVGAGALDRAPCASDLRSRGCGRSADERCSEGRRAMPFLVLEDTGCVSGRQVPSASPRRPCSRWPASGAPRDRDETLLDPRFASSAVSAW